MKTWIGMLAVAATLLAQEPKMKKGNRPPRVPRPGVSDPAVKHPMSEVKPDAVFEVPGVPDWLVITKEATWVSNKPKGTVSRMDTTTNKVSATIDVGKQPCSGITSGFGSIWVPLCGDKALVRLDAKTNKILATIPLGPGNSEGGLAASKNAIWYPTDKGTLARIDPKTNKVVTEIPLPTGSYAAEVAADGSVWVTSTEKSLLVRVDPKKNKVIAEIPVGDKPRFLATGAGAVWTYDQGKGTITRVDIKTNKVAATIEAGLPGGGGEIDYADGYVWVTSFEHPITKIDVKTNKVVGQWSGPGGDAIQAGGGFVWLSNLREQNVWKIKAGSL
jgi:virginiamycin B lyase